MENLKSVLDSKKLKDLQASDAGPTSNLIEPTVEEIETIVQHLKDGKSHKWIKQNYRRTVSKEGKQISAKGFSYKQIDQIDQARLKKIQDLAPKASL